MAILDDHRRWLQGASYYSGRQATPAKNDPEPASRRAVLERAREKYRYNHDALAPIPLLTDVPPREHFAEGYILGRTERTARLLPNAGAWKVGMTFDHFDHMDDFAKMYPILPKPTSIPHWERCDFFASQRLGGPNPMAIQRVTDVEQIPFELPDAAAKIADGRLFMTDYRSMSFIKGGKAEDGRQKHLPIAVGVFEHDGSKLVPVAIHLDRRGETVFRGRADANAWLAAKICHQVADSNHHEMVVHLAHTHLNMEPFVIATSRQLADNHPVAVLLRPHFRFLLTNNALGLEHLLNPGGIVDHLLAGTLEESLKLVTDGFRDWSIDKNSFDNDIVARGVDDRELLPNYAWRDDAQLLWDAIGRYVRRYLGLYYPSPADIAEDAELQAWAAELAHPDFGRINDMPARIENVEQIAKLAQTLIFNLGPQHSAVNYAQWDYFGFVPNAPMAAYCHSGDVSDYESLMKMLPPESYSEQQLEAADELTCYRFDKLGHFKEEAIVDARAVAALEAFRSELWDIETEIDRRNEAREFPYIFLKPSLILNSPSI